MNSMFYMLENQCQFDRGDEQLVWLEKQLSDSTKTFYLSMHVFPGIDYFNGKAHSYWH